MFCQKKEVKFNMYLKCRRKLFRDLLVLSLLSLERPEMTAESQAVFTALMLL